MDTRKIQTVGGATYTVSLPPESAKSQYIAAGDTVNLHSHIDGVLVIQAQECEDEVAGKTSIQVAHDDTHFLEQTLRAAYAAGAKDVKLHANETFTPEQRRIIDQVARNLPGVSVIEESDTRITIRTLLDTDEVSVRQSVRQLKFVALSMHQDATAALTEDHNTGNLNNRDNQADRLYAIIDRSFARGLTRLDEVDALGMTRPELFELWATARELERVADHAESIGTAASRIQGSVEGALLEEACDIAREAREIVAEAVSVVVGDTDAEAAQQALAARDQVRRDITAFERQLSELSTGGDRFPLVLDRLRRTAEHGGNIAELGLRPVTHRDNRIEPLQDTGEQDDTPGER
jgi:phosphate uptake regulator